jgi:(2R)-3-sulfolactate dehydrogenase (NADP+)
VDGTAVPTVERARPALLRADAGAGFAHAAIALGFEHLVPLAREQGVAALAIHDSYNCGVLGVHTRALAARGLLGIGFTNAPASIAPAGGARPALGTNPVSLAAPDGSGGAALLIDQSASVVAKSEIMKHAREGRAIPEHWALDADGAPTTDPEQALAGSMAPAGGYKGAGLALMTELMAAALTGASLGTEASPFSGPRGGPPRTGQFFLALDPEASSGGAFAERLSALASGIRAQPGARLPGDGRAAARARARQGGVAVAAATLARVRELTA